MRRVRLIGAATPVNAEAEIERLTAALAAGRPSFPQWTHRPEQTTVPEIEGAHALVRARLDELRLEAAMAEAVGTPAFAAFAAERFREPERALRAADRIASSWAERISDDEGEELVRTDGNDSRSLLSQVRAAIGRARAPFTVRVSPLGALAATGDHTVYVARGRSTTPRAAQRIALHEVLGHVLPRVRAKRLHWIFE
ncbi:MAG TPA: tyrosine/phenylalanine carboxypeptidase domain-containing protein, partial [Polyangiaceae bacterium]